MVSCAAGLKTAHLRLDGEDCMFAQSLTVSRLLVLHLETVGATALL